MFTERVKNPFLSSDFIYNLTSKGRIHNECIKLLHSFTKSVIAKRDAEYQKDNYETKKRKALLDLLLEQKHEYGKLSLEDIREEVDTFMFTGHDTTAIALSWICHTVGSYPEVQQRIHEEIYSVFGIFSSFVVNNRFLNNIFFKVHLIEK